MATHGTNASMWEPRGYPRLARVMAEHPQLSIFRRFDTCTHLSLMSLQAQLIVAQRDFQESCKKCDTSASEEETRFTGDFLELMESRSDNGIELQNALKAMRERTSEYNGALLQAYQVSQLPLIDAGRYSPIETLQKWLYRKSRKDSTISTSFLHGLEFSTWETKRNPLRSNPSPADIEEHTYSKWLTSSFVTLDSNLEDQDPVSKRLTPALINLYHWVWKGRRASPDVESQDGLYDYQYSRLTRVARTLAIIVASALPILAILALYFIHSLLKRIYVMIAFTIVFAAAISTFTPANMVEIFASTSAFAAVEVVFIGSTALS